MAPNVLRVSNQETIRRVLEKALDVRLLCMIKYQGDTSISVKGNIIDLITEKKNTSIIRFGNISSKGLKYLREKSLVQIECSIMSKKVIFTSRILSMDISSIFVEVPEHLLTVNRRSDERYKCLKEFGAFFKFSNFAPGWDDFSATPFYSHYGHYSGLIAIDDISLGGASLRTNFPAINKVTFKGFVDHDATFIFPMQQYLRTSIELRWIKKIKEYHQDHVSQPRPVTSYRLGLQFIDKSPKLLDSIRIFIHQLNQKQAI